MVSYFINRPEDFVLESIEGAVASVPYLRRLDGFPEVKVIFDGEADKSKVAVISGGGSGHEPAHGGYVGRGMLTAAVAGDVFASPPTEAVLAAIRTVTNSAGVLVIIKNYTEQGAGHPTCHQPAVAAILGAFCAGDRLNFGLAVEQAKSEGYKVEMLVVGDDCALPYSHLVGRRGIAGTVFVHKVAGASAAAGDDLATVLRKARGTAQSMGSMGVATSVCTVPGSTAADPPRIGPGEMELGLGIHGEPGASKGPLKPVDEIVALVLHRIMSSETDYLSVQQGAKVALLVNSLGSVMPAELHIAANAAISLLQDTFKVEVARVYVGTFMTSLDMAGFSLTVLVLDDERIAALDADTQASAWPRFLGAHVPNKAPVPVPSGQAGEDHMSAPEQLSNFGSRMKAVLSSICEAVIQATPDLDALDAKVGDGDCGSTLKRGAEAIKADMTRCLPLNDAAGTLKGLARTLRVMGGTSGVLYVISLTAAAGALHDSGASAGDQGPSEQAWADAFAQALLALQKYSRAQRGDRTMLDALIPAQQAFSDAAHSGEGGKSALEQACKAAEEGAAATKAMGASAGRSSYVPEEVLRNVPDPGAQAVSVWLRAILNTAE